MTTTKELLIAMFKENTGKSILDSGGAYGRNWQHNQTVDFDNIPQATLCLGEWGPEVSVSSFRHCLAMLNLDAVCQAFNLLPVDDWDGTAYGVSELGQEFLDRIGADVSDCWNTYNWDTSFDQILQGHNVEINGEGYVLLQIHGGCDARGGYTDAKLFKLDDPDYWLCDDTQFTIDAYGLEDPLIENGEIFVDVRARQLEVYVPSKGDAVAVDEDFFKQFKPQKVEGTQNAVEH